MNHSCAHPTPVVGRCSRCKISTFCSERCFQRHIPACISAAITPADLQTAQDIDTKYMRYIHGPIRALMFEFENVQWMMFGDEHTAIESATIPEDEVGITLKNNRLIFTGDTALTWSIERLLFNMFTAIKKSGKTADFYLELPILSKSKSTEVLDRANSNYIYQLYNIFNDCFFKHILPDETVCTFAPNVKMHFVDYRQRMDSKDSRMFVPGLFIMDLLNPTLHTNLFNQHDILGMLTLTYDVLLHSDSVADDLQNIWTAFIYDIYKYAPPQIQTAEQFKLFETFVMSYSPGPSKLKKQIDKLDEPVRGKLLAFFSDKRHSHSKFQYTEYTEADTLFLKEMYTSTNRIPETDPRIRDLYVKILHNDTLLMDAYGLARALYTTSALKVLYAGDYHVGTWIDFFVYMGVPREQVRGARGRPLPGSSGTREKLIQLTDPMVATLKRYI